MAYLWSDHSLSNPPSSPLPGPSTSRHSLSHILNHDDDDASSAYPTPPLSEADLFATRRLAATRHRQRTSSSARSSTVRSYRQPTLSECLSRVVSSPLGGRASEAEFNDGYFDHASLNQHTTQPAHRDDEDGHDPQHRPSLVPLAYLDRIKRARLESDCWAAGAPSSDMDISMMQPMTDELWSEQIADHITLPPTSPRPRRSRIRQHPHQILGPELAYRPREADPRGMKKMESLRSEPDGQLIKLWNEEYAKGYEFPFSLCFNHAAKAGDSGQPPAQGELMAVASAMGLICLYRPSLIGHPEDLLPLGRFNAIQNGVFALSFSPSDLMLGTGSGERVSEIFDVDTGNVIGRLQDHAGTVKTVEFSPENEMLVVTGSRDGSIKIWDLRIVGNSVDGRVDPYDTPVHPPVITIQNAHDEKHTGRKRKKGAHVPSVSSVLWARHKDRHLFSAGSTNGVVKLWDIRKKTPFCQKTHPVPAEQSIEHSMYGVQEDEFGSEWSVPGRYNAQRPHGISSLVVSLDGARVYALGTDSTIRTHDALHLSRGPTSQLRAFSHPSLIATSLFVKLALSNCDRYLACGSSTGEIYIWDTWVPEQHGGYLGAEFDEGGEGEPVILDGHVKEVCGLEFWNQGIGSCSDDSDVRVWSYKDAWLEEV